MRDQYAGDIRDLVKYAFLRALAGDDRRLGVAWYYDPGHDGRNDGKHVAWRDEIAWRALDSVLFDALSGIDLSDRSVAGIERLPIWPQGTCFHRDPILTGPRRAAWLSVKRTALETADLMFLDPDNGFDTDPHSAKHMMVDEVTALRCPGRAIAFIVFPRREKHAAQLRAMHAAVGGNAMTLVVNTPVKTRTGLAPRICWFTVVDPDRALAERIQRFAACLSTIPRVTARLESAMQKERAC